MSFNALAWLAWLYVYGYTGLLLGRSAGHALIGGVAGAVIGLPISVALGTSAHYGSPVGLLGIPFAVVLAIARIPWLGLVFSAVPLATALLARSAGRLTERRLGRLGESLDSADTARLVEYYRYSSNVGGSAADELKRKVLEGLVALGDAAVREVIAGYGKARSRRERTLLIGLLGNLRHPDSTQFIMDLLAYQKDTEVLGAAVAAAAHTTDPLLVPGLVYLLEHQEDHDLRAWAVGALGSIKGPEAISALTRVLRQQAEGALRLPHEVQFEAVRSLGLIGSAAAVETLRSLTPYPEYHSALRWALEALGADDARRELTWLSELVLAHEDEGVRGGAALALARTGAPAARDVLKQALEGDLAALEYCMVKAAGEAADPALLPRLTEIATRHPAWNLRAVAVAGLARMDAPDARHALAGILANEKEPAVLERLLEASSVAWDVAFVPGLASVAGSEEESISPDLRRNAVRALGRIPGPEARAALEELLDREGHRGLLKRDRTVMSEIGAALGVAAH